MILRCFVNADINNNYYTENDPQVNLESNQTNIQKENPEESNNSPKTVYGPTNETDWKVRDVGLNQIQSPRPLVLHTLKERNFTLSSPVSMLDADAFARYAKWDAWHQNQLNQLAYIEERIEADRDSNPTSAEENQHIKKEEDSSLQINIERMEAA